MKIIKNERDEALAVHYMLLSRQIAELAACIQHIFRLQTSEESKKEKKKSERAYKREVQATLGDIVYRAKQICEVLELDFRETEVMGDNRGEEKKEEFLKKHPTKHWF